jgi:hypothetical protein
MQTIFANCKDLLKMQQTMPKIEEYSIEEMERLIESIKRKTELNEEEIAKTLKYNQGYISQTRSRGKVSVKFVQALQSLLNTGLQNANIVQEPQAQYGTVHNLTESNRMLAESVQKMVNVVFDKLPLLDLINSNLGKIPDSMSLLTDLSLKNQEAMTGKILEQFADLKKRISSAESSVGKKISQNQKR